jgi:hypothetical protein
MRAAVSARSGLAILAVGVGALALAYAISSVAPRAPSTARPTTIPDAGAPLDAGARPEEPGRFGDDGAILAPPSSDVFQCRVPRLPIPHDDACDDGAPYPACRWGLPDEEASGGLYRIWRNTVPEHRWARPGLVSLVLAAAREYALRWPGEHVTIGDLDAAGPRHQTHDHGVDVDLYLEHAMADRNEPGRARIDNYHGLSRRAVRLHRARVLDFAKILATCARGRIRIYYADREVVDAFRAWFTEQGLVSDVSSQAMQMHNDLHRFHFHLTTAEDLEVLPVE